jgi:predicted dehydrogenase
MISPQPSGAKQRVRYAVVGLGHIAQAAVLPAFAHASENSELRALVSGDPAKLRELSKKYDVPLTYTYEQYDRCLQSGEVDAVYIALPNSMHCEYSMTAARAGVHVLCEKPMAVTEDECKQMMEEARQNRVRLMIAYRLLFDKSHQGALYAVASGAIGHPRIFHSVFTMQVKAGNVRLKRNLGGGPLYDIGIYCLNSVRHCFGAEPEEVFAFSGHLDDPRFVEVEESTSTILRFSEGRLATFTCSFGAAHVSSFEIIGTTGSLCCKPAYERAAPAKHYLVAGGKTEQIVFPQEDQFARELSEFSCCVLENREPLASGEEGLADVRIIRALYRSIESGRSVKLA